MIWKLLCAHVACDLKTEGGGQWVEDAKKSQISGGRLWSLGRLYSQATKCLNWDYIYETIWDFVIPAMCSYFQCSTSSPEFGLDK